MPSTEHQWLVLWLARMMERDGYRVTAYDGPTPQGGLRNAARRPRQIGHYRPDLLGVKAPTEMAIGEAKSLDDIDTPHTRLQLAAFGGCKSDLSRPGALYIAIPRSGVWQLDRVLQTLHLVGASHIRRVHVPDCLITARL
jgi:hypothetical protein